MQVEEQTSTSIPSDSGESAKELRNSTSFIVVAGTAVTSAGVSSIKYLCTCVCISLLTPLCVAPELSQSVQSMRITVESKLLVCAEDCG